ncbi:hypothetical protein, partial [Acidianus sp. RZ1]|uniref:hypothetical protein n=1 Tax=Acidianus sp. RZ1 TaxID=1540082 RepID=UPI001C11AEC7
SQSTMNCINSSQRGEIVRYIRENQEMHKNVMIKVKLLMMVLVEGVHRLNVGVNVPLRSCEFPTF